MLIYSPFIRLVLFNVWFQIAFFAMVLVSIFIALYLPKIWTVSPRNFLPVVKVSGLDMTQNWALKRGARKAMENRDFTRAAQSWEGAVAQNPGDEEALRGYLQNTLNLDRADKSIFRSSISQMGWLLRLTHTNANDVRLIAQVAEKFKWHDVAAYFLGGLPEPLPPEAEAAYLKALFQQKRFREFEPRFTKYARQLKDNELPLYELASRASSRGATARDAEVELERLSTSGPDIDLAARLHMLACGEKGNIAGYSRSLERLALRNQDNVADHATYWVLLSAAGRKDEAVSLAKSFTRAPASAIETVRLADAYYQLDLADASRELLARFASSFHQAPEVWVAYAAVLEKLQDWGGMRAIALQIREDLNGRDTLWGYAYFLEGRAELAEKRLSSAERAFEKAAESSYEIPPLGFAVAKDLARLKFAGLALKIYSALENSFENDLPYWEGVFDAAFAVHDAAAVLKASERCYRLSPRDAQVNNRYAAAMLVNRSNPDEVIHLTVQLLATFPNSTAAKINHAFALILNQRISEALDLLRKISPAQLTASEISDYHLALFEIYCAQGRWDDAASASEKIARSTLFPNQRLWLEQKLKQLPPRQIAGTS
jgi:hypothetical protein